MGLVARGQDTEVARVLDIPPVAPGIIKITTDGVSPVDAPITFDYNVQASYQIIDKLITIIGTFPFSYSVSGLPDWLRFDDSGLLSISGIFPRTAVESGTLTLTVSNERGSARQEIKWVAGLAYYTAYSTRSLLRPGFIYGVRRFIGDNSELFIEPFDRFHDGAINYLDFDIDGNLLGLGSTFGESFSTLYRLTQDRSIFVRSFNGVPKYLAIDSNGSLHTSFSGKLHKVTERTDSSGRTILDAGVAFPSINNAIRVDISGFCFDNQDDIFVVLDIRYRDNRTERRIFRRAGGYASGTWDAGIVFTAFVGITYMKVNPDDELLINSTGSLYKQTGGYPNGTFEQVTIPAGARFRGLAVRKQRFRATDVKVGITSRSANIPVVLKFEDTEVGVLPRPVNIPVILQLDDTEIGVEGEPVNLPVILKVLGAIVGLETFRARIPRDVLVSAGRVGVAPSSLDLLANFYYQLMVMGAGEEITQVRGLTEWENGIPNPPGGALQDATVDTTTGEIITNTGSTIYRYDTKQWGSVLDGPPGAFITGVAYRSQDLSIMALDFFQSALWLNTFDGWTPLLKTPQFQSAPNTPNTCLLYTSPSPRDS